MPIQSEWRTFTGANGDIRAYVAAIEPVTEPRPTVIVIQEIWGVDAHIQDVAQRFAAAGYVAIAPDLFAENGVRPNELNEEMLKEVKSFLHSIPHPAWFNPDAREAEISKLPNERQETMRAALNTLFGFLDPSKSEMFVNILKAAADYARNTYEKTKNMTVTSVGFCLGGALSAALAVNDQNHAGAVVFYGRPPKERIDEIQCPILGFYGGNDPNITNLIPAFEEEMKKLDKSFEAIVYPDAQHAFFNDTNPTYNARYARDSFAKALTFLNQVTAE
ncbi:dienelactone hydrolase family protein [Neobacillus rhizophilus]|uniref:Dienelactone hydrolase family protein n=1 Tax=Neobacillus rhizophilus TaxID=2833579 RepID=A0A942YVS2_9BACI|nr:dienelactone hydrolase family protein [Neobacillus rhizophilus]MBS4214394.1 dienelactone hydrolase family protein [Neobacillus rhizophilus]MBU8918284.1 dienelactone hydrolase family protein [Bacillus sp. FJAT-29953]